VLVFYKTSGFNQTSGIKGLNDLIFRLGRENGFQVDSTDNSGLFTPTNLKRYDVVVFNDCSRAVLPDSAQQQAMRRYMEQGGGFLGNGDASEHGEYWTWYAQELISTNMNGWTPFRGATVNVDSSARNNPEVAGILKPFPSESWKWTDNWFAFKTNPRNIPGMTILLTLDESSITTLAPTQRMGDHPIAWCHKLAAGADGKQGRALYTATGWSEDLFGQPYYSGFYLGALQWASGDVPATAVGVRVPTGGRKPGGNRLTGKNGAYPLPIPSGNPHGVELATLDGRRVLPASVRHRKVRPSK
jgi:type 1 glutamine amidotransferase